MADQPKLESLETSDFFPDGQASREWLVGTVSRGNQYDEIIGDSEIYQTGMDGNEAVSRLPEEVVERYPLPKLLRRGQERYAIFCSHCHDLRGDGQGIVPQRGFAEPPTFHSNRLREAPLGYIYQVISYGRGRMPAHGGQIPPIDRWAIASYVRALQLSQHVDVSLLEKSDIDALDNPHPTSDR